MKNIWVAHYHEIALKGRNRPQFLSKLAENIRQITSAKAQIVPGRIIINTDEEIDLSKVFGISSFSKAIMVKAEYEAIEKAIESVIPKDFNTFAIQTTRGDKRFPLTSQKVNEKLGEFVMEKFNKKVDLTNPEVTFYVEIFEKGAILYTQRIPGPGGLPVGIQGKVGVLLSGGIDSPVAAWRVMKRGASVIAMHFHSYPFTSKASIDKVKELVEILNAFNGIEESYFIPIADIQKEIVKNCNERYRILLYRRFMVKIAQRIALEKRLLALVTGESLGQVASQTLENIFVVDEASLLPIFRPLIGYDKEEIIKEAKAIGTYSVSIRPHDDCCSLFMPKQVIIRANLNDVKREESKLNIDELIESAYAKIIHSVHPHWKS